MEQLFHYSTINKLALILSSKKIRFNRLDYVNDPHEGVTDDFGSMAIYFFVSCWTKNKEENLALWNMYTEKMRGIRIELPLPLFNSNNIGKLPNYIIKESEYLNDNDGLFILDAQNEPIDIIYTDDEDKLHPKIQFDLGLKTSVLGIAKSTIWKIENESRYIMQIYPYDPNVSKDNFPDAYEKYIEHRIPPSINFYDVEITKKAFEEMKIVIGPKVHPGDKEIIKALVAEYNPNAVIFESKLTGHIS